MAKKYKLEKEPYFETIWYIRQYPSFLQQYEEVMTGSTMWGKMKLDGMPHGSSTTDMVASAAERLVKIAGKIAPIQKALNHIPEEYRDGILGNIIGRRPYPIEASISTWKRWKQRFVFYVFTERESQ